MEVKRASPTLALQDDLNHSTSQFLDNEIVAFHGMIYAMLVIVAIEL